MTSVVYRARYASVYRIRYLPNTDRAGCSVFLGMVIPAQPAIPSNTEPYRPAAIDTELHRPHTVQHITTKTASICAV
jgi:hypothetical protein